MATLYIFDAPLASTQLYDKVRDRLPSEAPEGALFHAACTREGGGLLVVEVWESEEAQAKWSQILDRAIADAGGPPRTKPQKHAVHNMRSPNVRAAS